MPCRVICILHAMSRSRSRAKRRSPPPPVPVCRSALTHHRGFSTWAILPGSPATGIEFLVTRVRRVSREATDLRNLCIPLAIGGESEDDGEWRRSQVMIIRNSFAPSQSKGRGDLETKKWWMPDDRGLGGLSMRNVSNWERNETGET
jgi:hypothetical protein